MALTVGTNSYINTTDADTYFSNRLFADIWTATTPTDKEKALIMATKVIDRQFLKGRKRNIDTSASKQLLAFPRCYSRKVHDLIRKWFLDRLTQDYDIWFIEGAYTYCEAVVPQVVLDATCEEALALLDRGNSKRLKLQRQGVKSFSIGDLSETYATWSGKGLLSEEAKELMQPYLGGAVSIL
jgi:hypothetical protein